MLFYRILGESWSKEFYWLPFLVWWSALSAGFSLGVTLMVVPAPSLSIKTGISTLTLQMYVPESILLIFPNVRFSHLFSCSLQEPSDWLMTVLFSIKVWFFSHFRPTLPPVSVQQQVTFTVFPSRTETSALWLTARAWDKTPAEGHSHKHREK